MKCIIICFGEKLVFVIFKFLKFELIVLVKKVIGSFLDRKLFCNLGSLVLCLNLIIMVVYCI